MVAFARLDGDMKAKGAGEFFTVCPGREDDCVAV
jgi:hypothetical protein